MFLYLLKVVEEKHVCLCVCVCLQYEEREKKTTNVMVAFTFYTTVLNH